MIQTVNTEVGSWALKVDGNEVVLANFLIRIVNVNQNKLSSL